MSGKQHVYRVTVEWTGNRGNGTARYNSYGREHSGTGGRERSGFRWQRAGFAVHQRAGMAHGDTLFRLPVRDQGKQWFLDAKPDLGLGAFLFLGTADFAHQNDRPGARIVEEHRQHVGEPHALHRVAVDW